MSRPPSSARDRWLLVVGLAFVAANLRPAVASVGPVLDDLRASLGLSATAAAVLTTAPVVCFGALAPIAPRLARRFGMRRALLLLLAALTAGLALRVLGGTALLYVGTVLAAAAIAAANVLVPALVKRDFPRRIGPMMGLYTTALTGAAAAAAGLTVPIGHLLGRDWRGALGIWAVFAALALLAWAPQSRAHRHDRPPVATDARPGSLLGDRVAWMVTGFFGLQSLGFYAVLSWLPTLYRSHGYDAASAGALLSISALVQAPIALVVPTLAARVPDQRRWVLGSVALTAAGFAGILLAPTAAPYLWVVLLGVGQGASFPVALTLIVLRTSTSEQTAQLSAMAQTLGYLIAGVGPLAVGAIHDATGSWTPSVVALLALMLPQAVLGVAAARDRVVAPRRAGTVRVTAAQ